MNPILQAMQLNKLVNGNPNDLYEELLRTNPQFRSFVENNKGKSPEQIAKENGIDYNQVLSMMNRR